MDCSAQGYFFAKEIIFVLEIPDELFMTNKLRCI